MYIDNITKEEENCINDILSDGIDEIRDLTQKKELKPKMKQEMLKTSINANGNVNELNLNSNNSHGNSNSNSGSNRNNDMHTHTGTHSGTNIDMTMDNNMNLFNTKIQISDFNSKQMIHNDNNTDIAPKSSALRELINKLKQENNYILSSDDDNESNTNNKEEIDKHIRVKIPQKNNTNTNKMKIKSDANIKQEIENLEESTHHFSSMKTQMDYIQNRIKKINGTMLLNRNETTNTNCSINKMPFNSDTNRSYSLKHKVKKNLYLTDDINQRHHRGISSSNSNNNSNRMRFNNNYSTTASTVNTQRVKNNSKPIVNKSQLTNRYNNKDHNYDNADNEDEDDNDCNSSSFNQGSPINNNNNNNSNEDCNYQSGNNYTLKAKSKPNPNPNTVRQRKVHSQLTHVSSSPLLNQLTWRKKYEDLKDKHHNQLNEIALERKKASQLEKTIRVNKKKSLNYNTLIDYNKQLINQDELLMRQIAESENIRKEQSKLIRSLQREIDMLRGEVDESNLNNIAEVYQAMKESLIESNNKLHSGSLSNSQINTNNIFNN